MKVRIFSLVHYLEQSLRSAEYTLDENGLIVARVPGAGGFFAQGDNVEEARDNLREVIEGNVLLALQLGLPIPEIKGVEISERRVPLSPRKNGKAHAAQTTRRRA